MSGQDGSVVLLPNPHGDSGLSYRGGAVRGYRPPGAADQTVYTPQIRYDSYPFSTTQSILCVSMAFVVVLLAVALGLSVQTFGLWFRGDDRIIYTRFNATITGDTPQASMFDPALVDGELKLVGALEFRNDADDGFSPVARIAASNPAEGGFRRQDTGRLEIITYDAGSPSVALHLDQKGNVGVGRADPVSRLHAAGTLTLGLEHRIQFEATPAVAPSGTVRAVSSQDGGATLLVGNGGPTEVLKLRARDQVLLQAGGTTQLDITGAGAAFSNGVTSPVGFFVVSDERLKKDVTDHDAARAFRDVMSIEVKDFSYRDPDLGKRGPDARTVGLIAQQVARIVPEAVRSFPRPNGRPDSEANATLTVDPYVLMVKLLAAFQYAMNECRCAHRRPPGMDMPPLDLSNDSINV